MYGRKRKNWKAQHCPIALDYFDTHLFLIAGEASKLAREFCSVLVEDVEVIQGLLLRRLIPCRHPTKKRTRNASGGLHKADV